MTLSTAGTYGPARGSRWRGWSALLALCFGLVACGGGGGDGGAAAGAGAAAAQQRVVQVSVVDSFNTAIAGATVTGPQGATRTDAEGKTLVFIDTAGGTADVTVSRDTFLDKSIVATVTPGQIATVTVMLERVTSAAGGSLASRSGVLPVVDMAAQQMTFEIELVVVDGASQPIQNLTMANFVLRACTPDAANTRVDCLRGATANVDVAYTPATAAPEALAVVPGLPATPYAGAMLLDQSGSILVSDPTGARLYAAKSFFSGLGANDHALLAAFSGDPGALIPTPPLTVYAPFRTQTTAPSYGATLNGLTTQVGGRTPLFASLDALRQQIVADATLPVGLPKAIVIFTDGGDTDSCATVEDCRVRRAQSIQLANADQVRIFTIGLSSGVDITTLGELANQTGGAMLYAETADQLLPLYGSVGRLLSLSLPTYRLRWTVQAGTAGAFQSGRTLLGRVQVTSGNSTFDVPLVVGIP